MSTADTALRSRRVLLGGRLRTIHAPEGDAALGFLAGGGGLRHFPRLCRAALTTDSVCLDIGANIGLTALMMAEVARHGRVYAVEAGARNLAALRRNLSEHGASTVRPVHCAVGASEGMAAFFDNATTGYVAGEADMVRPPTRPVPLRRIDGLAEEWALSRLDFVKLDIEGAEEDALEGAGETLARFSPLVLLEFNSWCQIASYDRSPRRFLERLLDLFPELHVWRGGGLTSVREKGAYRFLHDHLTGHRCNTDLIGAFEPERIRAIAAGLSR